MISINNIHKSFNGNCVLEGINLEVPKGSITALIGRSGLGKSVLLKHIVGLLRPDSGTVFIDGENIHRIRRKKLEAVRKKFGYLFQDGALFDSLTVYDNVAFPLREKTNLKEKDIQKKVHAELQHMGLGGEESKFPAELSGGMKKRVSLARAMITEPSIMLFDEPTTGLDPVIGQSILDHIKNSHDRLKFTGIIVTHDVPRIFSIVNNVAMMHEGKVIVNGTLQEVHNMNNPVFEQFISGDIKGPVDYV